MNEEAELPIIELLKLGIRRCPQQGREDQQEDKSF
jgi:hypothetical protein